MFNVNHLYNDIKNAKTIDDLKTILKDIVAEIEDHKFSLEDDSDSEQIEVDRWPKRNDMYNE